jgi:hypothetical protein
MKRDIDAILKRIIQLRYENIECPPAEEVWKELEPMLIEEIHTSQYKIQCFQSLDAGKTKKAKQHIKRSIQAHD